MEFPTAFMRHNVQELATFPEQAALRISVDLIRRTAPTSLSISEFRSKIDLVIAEKCFRFPPLGKAIPDHWSLRLHREFNMTDDANLFRLEPSSTRLPLYEGKMIHQFDHCFSKPRYWLDQDEVHKALVSARLKESQRLANECEPKETIKLGQIKLDYQVYRLAFRDVAASTNERTMIATILPAKVVCPHTMTLEIVYSDEIIADELHLNVCGLQASERLYLLAVLNSFVVDYQLRQRITNHLSYFFVYSLPVPRLREGSSGFRPLVERAARLVGTTAEFDNLLKEVFGPEATHQTHGVTDEAERLTLRAEIDSRVAQLYDLTEEEFDHILSTFPLVKEEVKTRTLDTFRALLPSADAAAVAQLIAGGETDKVEFKEGAAYSRQVGRKQPEMLTKVLREVAAFLNTSGGSVLIGVDDAGKVVGLTDDFPAANERKPNPDGYGLFLREAMSNRLDPVQTISCTVTFHRVNDQDVCRILVPASPKPVYFDGELLIRAGTTSRSLRPQDATKYVFQHWGTLS